MIYLFHTAESVVFVAAVFALHWAAPARFRNAALLAASYVCYAAWDWRFLGLLAGSTLIDYACGPLIARSRGAARRRWLLASVLSNVLILGFFKYYRFFAGSLAELLAPVGAGLPLDVILPIGLSYHTFQKISYSVDVYRGRIAPEKNLLDFALFVAWFPQLMAGPIEKARDLLPRLQAPRALAAVDFRQAAYLYLYGAFKKVVLGDAMAPLVARAFGAPDPTGAEVLLALYAFAVQLYGDFSGYSDMARGISLLFGVPLTRNFNLPFFSTSYIDFYRRWHISLGNWIAEYVYAPLSLYLPSRPPLRWIPATKTRLVAGALAALFVTRLVFALWHGATPNFFALGLFIFAAQLVAFFFSDPWRVGAPRGPAGLRVFATIHLFCAAMLLFRSASLAQAADLARRLLSLDPAGLWDPAFAPLYAAVLFLAAYETLQFRRGELFLLRRGYYSQLAFGSALLLLYIYVGAQPSDHGFIYFKF